MRAEYHEMISKLDGVRAAKKTLELANYNRNNSQILVAIHVLGSFKVLQICNFKSRNRCPLGKSIHSHIFGDKDFGRSLHSSHYIASERHFASSSASF